MDLVEKYLGENKSSAYKKDMEYAKKHNENPFYVDKEDGTEYVFGMGSGFAYSSPSNPKKEAEEMWKKMRAKIK